MATVAEQLRTGREALGRSIAQVADTTKMRTDHVRALEEGNYDVFVAPVYIRGFARTYARLLHLDEAGLMRTLDEELAQTEKFREHPSLAGPQGGPLDVVMLQLSRINWRLVLPGAGAALVLLLVFSAVRSWQERRTRDPLEGVGPGYYEPAGRRGGEALPLPASSPNRR